MTNNYTKFIFFTGKGGVGKTSLACSTAVSLADLGKKILLISTDPASNLEDVLQTHVSEQIQPHKSLPTLFTININPEVAAEEYRQRVIQLMIGTNTEEEIKKVKEELSGACTTEIASFDEFSRFVTGEGNHENYDHVIFDTAPTGHTIRLLELPAAWDSFLPENPSGASCIGPSAALKNSKNRYKKVVSVLRDTLQTTFFLVSKPETYSLKEAAKTSLELIDLGMANQKILINGIFNALDKEDPLAVKIEQISKKQLLELPSALINLPLTAYPLLPYNLLGLERLRSLNSISLQHNIIQSILTPSNEDFISLENIKQLVDTLEKDNTGGLIMTMGKGGVGKTIVAASIATMLASRGHQVLLTTTDPAAHVKDFMNQLDQIPDNLIIEKIDPKIETQKYIEKIFTQKGANLDENGKKLLLEDLQSPCTEEVAVFHAFSKAIQQAKRKFVVMDTAPTGHTLLLLDTTGSYHREILKNTSLLHGKITTPLMMLQDEQFAKIILVALSETTPMREAETLQNDLKRAGITPYCWVINQCLSSLTQIKDPLLKKSAEAESPIIKNIYLHLAKKTYQLPFIAEEKLLPKILSLYK